MLTMHPTLLIGPSDWQPDVMPREEFTARIDALWRHDPQAERAIVYGNSAHHAELAYFTNLVPKLEAAVAILSRGGEHRLLVGGGVNMLGAARPLTFIENVLPLKDVGDAIRADKSAGRTLVVGADYMPTGFRRAVTEAIGTGDAAQDATAQVWGQMSRKSSREVAALRQAYAAMSAGEAEMIETFESGAGVSAIVSAGEQEAYAKGAQDVRTLFSLDGGKTYRPFFTSIDQVIDPLNIYMAVRRFNYWVECFILMSNQRGRDPVLDKALHAKDSISKLIQVGTAAREIEQAIADAIRPYRVHPLTARAFAQRLGLALDERPYTDIGPTFEDGEVYSLRFGVTDGKTRHHIVEELMQVREGGNDFFRPWD
jgi:hypothetical protein